jgi:hypothetical protein
LLALAAGAALAACGHAAATGQPSATPEVTRLYPMRAGSVWTYDVDTGQGLPTLAITRVLRNEGARVEVSSGAEPIVYELRPDGLFRPDRNAYVLKAPLRAGARWDAGGGAETEVLDADKSVTTEAGSFQHCIEVLESGGQVGKRIRTIFCPDVGPVELDSSLQTALSGQTARVVARLRGYDFSGALAAPAAEPATTP